MTFIAKAYIKLHYIADFDYNDNQRKGLRRCKCWLKGSIMSEYSSFVWSSQNSLEWLIRYINGFVSIGHDIFVTNRSTISAKGFGYQVLNLPFLSCTLDRKVHLNFKAVRGTLTCLVLVYWIINWFYLLLYLFSFLRRSRDKDRKGVVVVVRTLPRS